MPVVSTSRCRARCCELLRAHAAAAGGAGVAARRLAAVLIAPSAGCRRLSRARPHDEGGAANRTSLRRQRHRRAQRVRPGGAPSRRGQGGGRTSGAMADQARGRPIRAPALAGHGWKLMGGRLLPDRGLPAAQFMYEDAHRPPPDALHAQGDGPQQHRLPLRRARRLRRLLLGRPPARLCAGRPAQPRGADGASPMPSTPSSSSGENQIRA